MYQAKSTPKPLGDPNPGPGDYNITMDNHYGGAKAAFKSSIERSYPFPLHETVGPGKVDNNHFQCLGLYKLSSDTPQHSFHLNKQKIWM